MDFETALAELCEYTGCHPATARARMAGAYRQQVREWNSAPRDTPAAVTDFYRTTDSYLYELVAFNYLHQAYQAWRAILRDEVAARARAAAAAGGTLSVLDFGAGIGSVLLDLAYIPGVVLTYADIPGPTFDFAAWRFRRRQLVVRMLDAARPGFLAGQAFDVIVTLEVLDHLPDPLAAAEELVACLRPGGVLAVTVNFNTNGGEAGFHLNADRWASESLYEAIAGRGLFYSREAMPRIFHKPGDGRAPATGAAAGGAAG